MSEPELPTAVYEGEINIADFKLDVVVLDDGRRLFKDTPELRRLLASLVEEDIMEGGGM